MNSPLDDGLTPDERRKKWLKPKTLADELKSLQTQIDKLPNAERFVLQTPNSEDADSAMKHLSSHGYQAAASVSEQVYVGDEKLGRSRMFEARAGRHAGGPVIAFLYRYEGEKRLKTVVVKIPDGISASHLLRAFFWGCVNCIVPPAVTSSHEASEYFKIKPLDEGTLFDRPRLQRELEVAQKKGQKEIDGLNAELASAERNLEHTAAVLAETERRCQAHNAAIIKLRGRVAFDKSLRWILSLSVVVLAILLLMGVFS